MKTRNLLVDVDSLIYFCHSRGTTLYEIQENIFAQVYDANLSLKAFEDMLTPFVERGCKLRLCGKLLDESQTFNYRYILLPEYKSKRVAHAKSLEINKTRELIYSRYKVYNPDYYCETDDLISLHYNYAKEKGLDVGILAIDKDFSQLDNVFNPIKDTYIPHNPKFIYERLLEGDAADGITGVKGYGSVKSKKSLEKCKTVEELENTVLEIYKKDKDLTVEDLYRRYGALLTLSPDMLKKTDNIVSNIVYSAFNKTFNIDLIDKSFTYE